MVKGSTSKMLCLRSASLNWLCLRQVFLSQEDLIWLLLLCSLSLLPGSYEEHECETRAGSASKSWKSCCFCSQGEKRSLSTGQNNNPALHPAPPQSPQSRASIKASCPALIFWTSLRRILSAWPAWRCHPTWICCPGGRRGSVRVVVGCLSALSPRADFFLSFSVMHPQSHCPILSLISLFITLWHTHIHTLTHSCTTLAEDNAGPAIAHGRKQEYVCVTPHRSNGS